jgi:beta-lactamase superfamily II metal-dependent hydrolase
LKSYNGTSAAWRVTFDDGTAFLVLGDCDNYACREIAAMYGDYVKSDILQVTHHGLMGGDKTLYQFIDPQICFWATPEERFLGN